MGFIRRIAERLDPPPPSRIEPPMEARSADPSWAALIDGGFATAAGEHVSPHLAENLAVVFACVQVISETVAMLPLLVYAKDDNGARREDAAHPVARLFSGAPNAHQTPAAFFEMMTAQCLLYGNAYAEIVAGKGGEIAELHPFASPNVTVRQLNNGRLVYDVNEFSALGGVGRTRRLLEDEVLHLRDRSDDGLIGKSRLARAREAFGGALATERYAASTFRNGASMSGVLTHPEHLGEEAITNLRQSFKQTYAGADKAGEVAVLEEGLQWKQISVSPDDAQMLESRKFSTAALARIFRVPPPVIGDFEGGNYSSLLEVGRWFYAHTVMPWLNKWERLIEWSLFSMAERTRYEVEFDADLLLRGDMLTRFQAYRIAREIGVYNANELRKFEKQNPRTDEGGETYFEPRNMQPEQTGRPIGDRTPGGLAKE